jgi:hypothetical protein
VTPGCYLFIGVSKKTTSAVALEQNARPYPRWWMVRPVADAPPLAAHAHFLRQPHRRTKQVPPQRLIRSNGNAPQILPSPFIPRTGNLFFTFGLGYVLNGATFASPVTLSLAIRLLDKALTLHYNACNDNRLDSRGWATVKKTGAPPTAGGPQARNGEWSQRGSLGGE